MLVQLIDGFHSKMRAAFQAQDYEELKVLDAAFVSMMKARAAEGYDPTQAQALMASIQNIQAFYKEAEKACIQERDQLKQDIKKVGTAHRNTQAYLSVASNSL